MRADQARSVAGDLLGNAAFRQRHRQTAFAAIVRAFDQAGKNKAAQGVVQFALLFQIAARRRAGLEAVDLPQISGAAQAEERIGFVNHIAQQNDDVPLVLEPLGGDVFAAFRSGRPGRRWGWDQWGRWGFDCIG